MERISLSITETDVVAAARYGIRNIIAYALQKQTGTLWRIYENGLALEIMKPHRACHISASLLRRWQQHYTTQGEAPFLCDLEMHATQAKPGYSLLQRRGIPDSMYA
ncbi:MAG TPA: hypothetical protein VF681_10565 [Abditibacteriaceae bacterium]|jgi:hypothetical protein